MGRPSCRRWKRSDVGTADEERGWGVPYQSGRWEREIRWVRDTGCGWASLDKHGVRAHLVEAHWPALKDPFPSGKLFGRNGRWEVSRVLISRGRGAALRTSKGSMDRYSSSIPTSSTERRHWMQSRIICFAWDALYPRAFRKRLCGHNTGRFVEKVRWEMRCEEGTNVSV
jgi:hypothetical protein